MTTVTTPRNGIPIGIATINGQRVPVEVHPEYLRWFSTLTTRVGGVFGSSTNDLTVSQFEDAGIEEGKYALYRLTDDIGQTPPAVQMPAEDHIETSIEELRAQILQLTKAVEALQQGLTA